MSVVARRVLTLLLLGAWWADPVAAQLEVTDTRVAEASDPSVIASRIHAAGDYPATMELREPEKELPAWLRDLTRSVRVFFERLAPAMQVLVYALLGALLLLLLSRLKRQPRVPQEVAVKRTNPVASHESASESERMPIGDPEAFAAEGQFQHAITLLLLLSLRSVGWGRNPHDTSKTAREVLRAVPASDRRRSPLGALVAHVEPIRFGGVEPSAAHYQEVRHLFLQLCEVA